MGVDEAIVQKGEKVLCSASGAGLALYGTTIFAQAAQAVKVLDPKALEASMGFAQSLTQWALLILGGSVAILVGTSYHAPKKLFFRYSYFLFFGGWLFLGRSMLCGANVNRAYLAYLWNASDNPEAYATINAEAFCQLSAMECALGIFGMWLLLYLVWWVLFRPREQLQVSEKK
ncbi:MAG TPA: hypothetical protein VKM93_28260 [Terriglobia bacterium]|nr:hypothetical protein [Terriglobia bacterium]